MFRKLAWIGWSLLVASAAWAQSNSSKGDDWLGESGKYPGNAAKAEVRSNEFAGLKAEFIAGRVKVSWPSQMSRKAVVHLVSSEEAPGHWPARDWRVEPMTPVNGGFEKVLRVEDLDVPQIYFVKVIEGAREWVSPMRSFQPRSAGMEMPTRVFWSFLEGFEEGTDSWRLLSPDTSGSSVNPSPKAKTGTASLQVTLGPKQQSVTVGTTRVRGTQMVRQRATGVRIWLRTVNGSGRARFTLHANAFTPEQQLAAATQEVVLSNTWQRIDLPFSRFPALPLGMVDFLSIEFIGDGAREFLVDNLELLGPWAAEE